MRRKVFKTHYIELLGCSSSTFLLWHATLLGRPGELKLLNAPEKSYGSKSWAASGWQGSALLSSRAHHPHAEASSPPAQTLLGANRTLPTSSFMAALQGQGPRQLSCEQS